MPHDAPIGLGTSFGDTIDFFAEGLYMAGTTAEQLQLYGDFYELLYRKIRDRDERKSGDKSKQVTRNAASLLRGAMYAFGSWKVGNPEWQEQGASSLREILHQWKDIGTFTRDYKEFFPNALSDSTVFDLISELFLHYQYFSGLGHHNASGVLGSLQTILKNKLLKPADCFGSTVFLPRVQRFLQATGELTSLSMRERS